MYQYQVEELGIGGDRVSSSHLYGAIWLTLVRVINQNSSPNWWEILKPSLKLRLIFLRFVIFVIEIRGVVFSK